MRNAKTAIKLKNQMNASILPTPSLTQLIIFFFVEKTFCLIILSFLNINCAFLLILLLISFNKCLLIVLYNYLLKKVHKKSFL